MKILVGYIDDCKTSGIDSYLRGFLKEAKANGAEIDFLTRNSSKFVKDEISSWGAGSIRVSRNRHPFKQFSQMRKAIKRGSYDIAYFNISESFNCIGVIAAKLCGVKKIIVHSHSSGPDKNRILARAIARFLNWAFKPILSFCSDLNLSCSDKAAEWLFSDKDCANNNFEIIKNLADADKFSYDKKTRDKIRKQLGVEGCFVIGHVGRFSYQKNHSFILKVFRRVVKTTPNAKLLLIGNGSNFDNIKRRAKRYGIYDKIIFTGSVPNVNDYLQAMDVFILPSHFEGMPFVGVEAQSAGLTCLFSSNITKQVQVSSNCRFISIHNPRAWANAIKDIKPGRNSFRQPDSETVSSYQSIIEDCSDKLRLDAVALKCLLLIHYVLNITAFLNGFNYLLIPSAALLALFTLRKFPDFFTRKKRALPFFMPLVLFIISYLATFFIAKNYDLPEAVKVLIWTLLHFFFIADGLYLKTVRSIKLEFYTISKFFAVCMSVVNLHNLLLLLFKVSDVRKCYNGGLHRFGISTWGRFYGNYYDPNFASVACVIATVLCLYICAKTKCVLRKILFALLAVINLVYVYMSESRTGLVAIAASIAAYLVFSLVANKKSRIKSLFVWLPILAASVFFAPKAVIESYNSYTRVTQASTATIARAQTDNQSPENGNENPGEQAPQEPTREEPISIGRTDSKDDLTNGRGEIWNNGLTIATENPIIGIGFANIYGYSNNYHQDSRISKYKFQSLHNSALDVTVSQGAIGAVLFLVIVATIAIYSLAIRNERELAAILFSIVITILAASMVVSQVFYVNNLPTFLFWLYVCYIPAIAACRKKAK